MLEYKELNKALNKLMIINEKIKNYEGRCKDSYEKIYYNLYNKIENINKLIKALNDEILRYASKVNGIYLKDLERLDISFIAYNYNLILTQSDILSRHVNNKISEKISEKLQTVSNVCEKFCIDTFNAANIINDLMKLENMLRAEVQNQKVVDGAMSYLCGRHNDLLSI